MFYDTKKELLLLKACALTFFQIFRMFTTYLITYRMNIRHTFLHIVYMTVILPFPSICIQCNCTADLSDESSVESSADLSVESSYLSLHNTH